MRRAAPAAVLVAALLTAGCASAPPAGTSGAAGPTPAAAAAGAGSHPADPWEAWNRKVFAFNDTVDEAILKPVATAYRDVVPRLVRTGIDNVLGNLGDVWSTANHFLQGKVETGLEMGMRVLTNTLFGLGGLLDPATEMRLVRRSEDFGQTLGRWGFGPGPYVVLPLLGPRTVRDTIGLVPDRYVDASRLPHTDAGSWAVTALEIVTTRANLLATTQLLGEAALDRYSFVRDAYLARRLDAVYDGAPPLETFDDEADPPATPAPKS